MESLIYVKRMSFLAGGIAHSAFGAVGISVFFNLPLNLVLLPFVILSSVIIGILSRIERSGHDTAIALTWAVGMSLGIVLIKASSKYSMDIASFLFGNILLIDARSIYISAIILGLVLLFVFMFYYPLVSIAMDEEYSHSLGLPVAWLYIGLIVACGLTVAVLMRLTGIILLMVMLLIPPAIAKRFSNTLKGVMLASSLISIVISFIGIILSYYLDFPVGPAMVFIAGICYLFLRPYRARR